MDRRQFLVSMAAASTLLALPSDHSRAATQKTLLVIELAGGNDGLNTFIPYQDPNYLRLRPTLGIQDGIPVTETVALHPSLADWQPLLEQGKLAVIQNVGYPDPDLSHFRSKAIWQSGLLASAANGWLARYLDSTQSQAQDAVFLGGEYPLALMGDQTRYLHLAPQLLVKTDGPLGQALAELYNSPTSHPLAERIRKTVLQSQAAVQDLLSERGQRGARQGYPQDPAGRLLSLGSRLVNTGAEVIYLTLSGWDTHTNQLARHGRLLQTLGQGLAALHQDLVEQGLEDQVLVMVQSEFGRRPAENGSQGTDHGTAGPVILMGAVRGGFYGGNPALDSLERGNLPYQIDFRSVYAEILQRWWQADPSSVLEVSPPPIGVLA
ncbi:MAG: DUF1501 domain-containing protein [Synechococcaceae cyanobacterium SM2_3_1]|nr:DUF1501 domain-containing protein [Synechococcaceae cyanobacterium SM2_3_1]